MYSYYLPIFIINIHLSNLSLNIRWISLSKFLRPTSPYTFTFFFQSVITKYIISIQESNQLVSIKYYCIFYRLRLIISWANMIMWIVSVMHYLIYCGLWIFKNLVYGNLGVLCLGGLFLGVVSGLCYPGYFMLSQGNST